MAAGISFVIGLSVLVGWGVHIAALRDGFGATSIKANTAIGFLLAGCAIARLQHTRTRPDDDLIAAGVAAVIVALMIVTLAEYALGLNLGIDHLFSDAGSPGPPGRPSPDTAIVFALVGLWVMALASPREVAERAANWLAAITSLIVLQAAIDYLDGVSYVTGASRVTAITLPTLGALVIVCVGAWSLRPRQSFMGVLVSAGAGGHVARRLAPPILVLVLVLGYLQVTGDQHHLFTARDGLAIFTGASVVLLIGLIIYTARSINRADLERVILEARLRDLADRDPLTGLYNRRHFDAELARHFTARHDTPMTLIMIDIDELKQINDTHGHSAGDQLIVGIANTLASVLRASDTAARVGGDEFAVILPHTDQDGAYLAADKLVKTIRDRVWEHHGNAITSTISAGIATTDHHITDPTTLYQAADRALYDAKAAGGNTHTTASHLIDADGPRAATLALPDPARDGISQRPPFAA